MVTLLASTMITNSATTSSAMSAGVTGVPSLGVHVDPPPG
jgi:hypothetical protein